MSILFFDTSAIVKRYIPEVGTTWVRSQTNSSSGNDIILSKVTFVEFYSAVSRQYHDGQIDLKRLQAFRQLFSKHIVNQYLVIEVSATVISLALDLQERHRLRAYDAIQLASALELKARLTASSTSFTFVGSDKLLLQAVIAEGLTADNPVNHP